MRVVVIGSGTGVGKTHAAVALVAALAQAGEQVAGLKPIESGVGEALTDEAQLQAVSTFHVKQPRPYALPDPVSPHLAAERAGLSLDLAVVTAWVDQSTASWTVVETAGALLSPLGAGQTNLTLAQALRPDALVLVAVDRLGVLHDVAACMLALRVLASELPPAHVALQAPATPDSSTGTNAAELVRLGTASSVVSFPRAEATDAASLTAAHALLRRLAP